VQPQRLPPDLPLRTQRNLRRVLWHKVQTQAEQGMRARRESVQFPELGLRVFWCDRDGCVAKVTCKENERCVSGEMEGYLGVGK
jgi:hypothetical protein